MVWCYYQCWHYLCPPPSVALNDHSHSVADVMQFSNLHKGTHVVYLIQTGDHLRLIAMGDTYINKSCNFTRRLMQCDIQVPADTLY